MSRAAGVTLLVLDVDGVLTDGSIVYDDAGHEIKSFHVRDGVGIRSWQRLGFMAAILTGRGGGAVERRAEELGISLLRQGSSDKGAAFLEMCREAGVEPRDAAFVGDDWPDLAPMRACGYPIAVADAAEAVRSIAAFVTSTPGGRGAVREAVEHLLEARGLLTEARAMYDTDHG